MYNYELKALHYSPPQMQKITIADCIFLWQAAYEYLQHLWFILTSLYIDTCFIFNLLCFYAICPQDDYLPFTVLTSMFTSVDAAILSDIQAFATRGGGMKLGQAS